MNKSDVIVVGAGLFGAATAKHLASKGMTVTVIDSNHRMAASKCSFGLWKYGWVNDKIKPYVVEGLDIVEELADGVREIELYNMKKNVFETMLQFNCENILHFTTGIRVVNGQVLMVQNKSVHTMDGQMFQASKGVILCCGAFVNEVLMKSGYPVRGIDQCWGAVMDVRMRIDENRIQEWAPYKQSIVLKYPTHDDAFMFGDGCTVKNPTNKDKRIEKATFRLQQHLNDITGTTIPNSKILDVKEGFRPYLKPGEEFVAQHDKNLWSASGAAKNGTLLCGYVAKKLFSEISGKKS